MNIVDIGIIIILLFGAVLGFKRGFTKELVKALGFVAVIVVAYFVKNPLSILMYENLPFYSFGLLKNIEILNILVYEALAFIVCIIILSLALKLLLLATTLFEKILNATVILGVPSKIAGALVGVIYHYIIVFLVLYISSLIFIDNEYLLKSKYREPILNKTPLLSELIDSSVGVIDEFRILKDKYSDKSISENEFNYQAFDLFLKYNVVTPESLEKLIESGKVESFENCVELINKYKENTNGN